MTIIITIITIIIITYNVFRSIQELFFGKVFAWLLLFFNGATLIVGLFYWAVLCSLNVNVSTEKTNPLIFRYGQMMAYWSVYLL